jgi:hypothetical protein
MSKYMRLFAVLALSGVAAYAQTASSKATAAINTAVWCTYTTSSAGDTSGIPVVNSCTDLFSGAQVTPTPDNFIPIMSTTIKVSNSQSLFVTPSLVTGLYTNTAVKSKTSGGTGSTSMAVAMGGVYLRAVLYDQNGNLIVAYPLQACTPDILGCQLVPGPGSGYGVVLDSRIQTLSQTLSGCTVSTGGTCSFDLTTQLILQTTSAHTFGFIFPNVGVGTYTVSIQAAVDSSANTSTSNGGAYAVGASAFGLGSVTVESVRLVHGFSF